MASQVCNKTDKLVRVVLTDTSNGQSTRILSPQETVIFQTPSGYNTFSLYKVLPGSNDFEPTSCADYTRLAGTKTNIEEKETFLQFSPDDPPLTNQQIAVGVSLIPSVFLGPILGTALIAGATKFFDDGQARTRILNKTDEMVRVVLTDANNRRSDHIFSPDEVFSFRSKEGRTTLSLLKKLIDDTGFEQRSCANYSYDRGCQFKIEKNNGHFQFVPLSSTFIEHIAHTS